MVVTKAEATSQIQGRMRPMDPSRDLGAIADLIAEAFASDIDKRQVWDKIKTLLQDARTLLMADPNYAPDEVHAIYQDVYKQCGEKLRGSVGAKGPVANFDTRADRAFVAIPEDADLDAAVAKYASQVREAERILEAD